MLSCFDTKSKILSSTVRKKNNNIGFKWVYGILGTLVVLVALSHFASSPSVDLKPPMNHDEIMAMLMAQQFIKQKLLVPQTAKFPWSQNDTKIYKISDNQWRVDSYVDSKNAFGTTIRAHYTCIVLYVANEGWLMPELRFIDGAGVSN